jgi:hypothetical protein
MGFLQSKEYLNAGDVVIVNSSHQCNIMLLDDSNFRIYQAGGRFTCYGGFYKMLPARIAVPSTGHWNIVLDLGGRNATIKYSIRVAWWRRVDSNHGPTDYEMSFPKGRLPGFNRLQSEDVI